MASSDNMASLEYGGFRHSFPDSWISDAFARETDVLTKALQKSLSNSDPGPIPPQPIKPEQAPTPGSDPESAPKRIRNPSPNSNLIPTSSGKITKRKSRASKRSPTTFITADPANFRQMVQQVTGIRFGGSAAPASSVLKPEPQRVGNRMQVCLPTLDTSAFLLDHHHQQVVGPTVVPPSSAGQVSFAPDCSGLDFETFPSFPTLESWRVM